jgi:tRNA wybutosine-synthesizing protein 4
MLAHFTKLRTPLNAVQKYQTTLHQEQRFRQAGWLNVSVWNLWELWGTSDFLTAGQRTALDDVEPFDEWEEFALFGCHYFLLVAKNTACPCLQLTTEADQAKASLLRRGAPPQTSVNLVGIKGPLLAEPASMKSTEYPKLGGRRRFGASMPIRGSDRRRDLVGNFGGLGLESRLNSYDLYVSYPSEKPFYHQAPPESPPGRMCHTITDLGDSGALLVGGRASPDNAFTDCWIFHKWTNTWERVDDLPSPRYRHSAVAIGDSVLVVSGKSDSRTFHGDFLVWNRRRGWLTCAIKILGNKELDCSFPVRFGAILAVDEKSLKNGHIKGILAGGISRDHLISEEVWLWTMDDQRLDVSPFTLLQPRLPGLF